MSNIDFQVILIRSPIAKKSDDWQETAYQWKVSINGQTFDYYTGSGLINKNMTPKKPTLDEVLFSLISDATACDMSFEDWCDELCHDTDSRKALSIYLACQENTAKLRKAGINIEAERERLQDY